MITLYLSFSLIQKGDNATFTITLDTEEVLMRKLWYTATVLILCYHFTACAQQKFDAHQLLTDIKVLASDDYEGRKSGTNGNKKAQEYIIKRFIDYKLTPFNGNYIQKFTFNSSRYNGGLEIEGNNIIGFIEGSKHPDEFIAICAHYYHLVVKNGEIFNGADDNASGVAGMFSIAEYYKQNKPDYSILFMAFDAEEFGLRGAKHFVANSLIPLEKLHLLVNMDMISITNNQELYACGTYHYPFLKPYVEEISQQRNNVTVLFGHDQPSSNNTGLDDWTNASDHGPFHGAGIPFIYFGVEDHEHYHHSSDTFDKIDQRFFVNVVDFIIDVMVNFDKKLPAIIEDKARK